MQIPTIPVAESGRCYTEINRRTSNIPSLVEEITAGGSNNEPKHIVSIGVGGGAELDTVLMVLAINGYSGLSRLTALDEDPKILEEAKSAHYQARYPSILEHRALKTKEKFGMTVGPIKPVATSYPAEESLFLPFTGEIDTSRLRQGQNIDFLLHDISSAQPLPIEEKADLILFNNCAYYLQPHLAVHALRKLIKIMKKGSILSMGSFPGYFLQREITMGETDVIYAKWLRKTRKTLADPELRDMTGSRFAKAGAFKKI